ncbi:MAG: phosphate ABC transporter permease subunit PstC [Armatimonadota bacterium]
MTTTSQPTRPLRRRGLLGTNVADRSFRGATLVFGGVVIAVIGLLGFELARSSRPALKEAGWSFLTSSQWDPVHNAFGVLFAIYGTVLTSLLALVIAVPIGLGAALFLAELSPRWLRQPLSFLIELLAAVPSIVYGLWGVFVLVPLIRPIEAWLQAHFGFLPLFRGAPYGIGVLAAALVLSVMVLPYITAVSREVLQAVPTTQREAAYALGATRWETIRGPVLRSARSGIIGAIILALGRAVGETMAVTMVIGNRAEIPTSLFSPAYTLASLIANEFAEATGELHISALLGAALILLLLTIAINALARLLIWRVTSGARVAA